MTVFVWGEVAIADLDRFVDVFSNSGLAKRREHGCLGAQVFAPAGESGVALVLLEFPEAAAFETFRTDPAAAAVMRSGGAQGPPTFRVLDRMTTLDA